MLALDIIRKKHIYYRNCFVLPASQPANFSPTGLFLLVLFVIINKSLFSFCNWVLALFPSTQPNIRMT